MKKSRVISKNTSDGNFINRDYKNNDGKYYCYSSVDPQLTPNCLPVSQEVKGRTIRSQHESLNDCLDKCQAVIPDYASHNIMTFLSHETLGKLKGKIVEDFKTKRDKIIKTYENASDEKKCELIGHNYGFFYEDEVNDIILPTDRLNINIIQCILDNPLWKISDELIKRQMFYQLLKDGDFKSIEAMGSRGFLIFTDFGIADDIAIEVLKNIDLFSEEFVLDILKYQQEYNDEAKKFFVRDLIKHFFGIKALYMQPIDKIIEKLVKISELIDSNIIGPIDINRSISINGTAPPQLMKISKQVLKRVNDEHPDVNDPTSIIVGTLIHTFAKNKANAQQFSHDLEKYPLTYAQIRN